MSATAMTMAAFLSLAGTCGTGIAPETLARISARESGFQPLAINVNGPGGGTVRGITTKAQAVAKARALIRAGRNIDAGVAQINSRNWEWLGLTVETAFDPCQSIRAQAALLRSYSRYNTGHPERGITNGYAVGVATTTLRPSPASPPVAVSRETPSTPITPTPRNARCAGAPPAWATWELARHSARCSGRDTSASASIATIEEYP